VNGPPGREEGARPLLIKSRMGISADGFVSTPEGAPPVPLTLLRSDRTFPDGSAELVYTPA